MSELLRSEIAVVLASNRDFRTLREVEDLANTLINMVVDETLSQLAELPSDCEIEDILQAVNQLRE